MLDNDGQCTDIVARALRSSGIAAHRAAEIWSDFIIGGTMPATEVRRAQGGQSRRRRKALS